MLPSPILLLGAIGVAVLLDVCSGLIALDGEAGFQPHVVRGRIRRSLAGDGPEGKA